MSNSKPRTTLTTEELSEKLAGLRNMGVRIEQARPNRFYLACEAADALAVSRFLFEDLHARFVIATAVDNDEFYEIIYHFAYDSLGCVINVKAFIRDRANPRIASLVPVVPGAEWIEREIHDLMGIDFVNHPRLERLILADDWPQGVYPLRNEGVS